MTATTIPDRHKAIFFFDIDNCLYPQSSNVHTMMAGLIDEYFASTLSLSREEAINLHKNYYQGYGLAIDGLIRHHQIDPLDFNSKVDDALPLEDILKHDPELQTLLKNLDRTRVSPWLFTNAYITHAQRVIKLLGLADLFDGVTYCDYTQQPIICKPSEASWLKAMEEAGATDVEQCYFVDDSYRNCAGAQRFGWTAVHLVENGVKSPRTPACKYQIKSLLEIRSLFPSFFKTSSV